MQKQSWLAAVFLVVGCGGSSYMFDVADAGVEPDAPGAADAGDGPSTDEASRADASRPEAAPSDARADADADACTPVLYYQDGDGDGYGGTTTAPACSPPAGAWVTQGGDCDDSNSNVYPGQTAYFQEGYVPTGKSSVSFDYNCDGQETELGASAKASCHSVVLSCVGAGYIEASPLRSGPGVDPYCGSDRTIACSLVNLSCVAGPPQQATPIACR